MGATHLVSDTVCAGAVVVIVSLGSVSVEVSFKVVDIVVRRSVVSVVDIVFRRSVVSVRFRVSVL
jgi:hypothetical protein